MTRKSFWAGEYHAVAYDHARQPQPDHCYEPSGSSAETIRRKRALLHLLCRTRCCGRDILVYAEKEYRMKLPSDGWIARWIWCRGEERPKNFYLHVRKTLQIVESVQRASIRVTADSRSFSL